MQTPWEVKAGEMDGIGVGEFRASLVRGRAHGEASARQEERMRSDRHPQTWRR